MRNNMRRSSARREFSAGLGGSCSPRALCSPGFRRGSQGAFSLADVRAEYADRAAVVQAFLSETPVPAGPEFLKHIEKARITADGQALTWSKQEDTYNVSLPQNSAQGDRRILRSGGDETRRADFSLALHGAGAVRASRARLTRDRRSAAGTPRQRDRTTAGRGRLLPRPARRGRRRQGLSRRR